MRKHSVIWLAMAALALLAVPAIAQDNLDGGWPSIFGGLYGTARAPFPVIFPPGGEVEVAWMLDPDDPNSIHFRIPPNASQIVFDSAGNLYWHSQGRYANGYVASCTPDGQMRWVGPPESLGQYSTDNTPVVGQAAVYMLGMFDPNEFDPNGSFPHCELTAQRVFALDKVDGSKIWRTMLDNESYCPEEFSCNSQPNPILYNGRLFVMGIPDPTNGSAVYQIETVFGAILGNNRISEINNKMCGNTCLLPNRFGPGVHAMYVLMFDDFWAHPPKIFCLRVDTTSNTTSKKWESDPNDVGSGYELGFLDWGTWGHIMYNPTADRIYVYTEDNSLGYELFSFDPNNGDDLKGWGDSADWAFTSAAYQTGALDFDDTRILTGAFDGGFTMYADDGSGNVSFVEALQHLSWDHPRQFVQLLQDSNGHTCAVTGTSGIGTGMTHIVMCDLDDRTDPAEDGPMYIDDIKVYQGPDIDHLTLVWSDDFEAYPEGDLPPASGWVSLHGVGEPAPQVVEDPTCGGQGKVLELDPVGLADPNDPNRYCGAYHAFAQTTGDVIVTRYKQWMQDTSEIYEVMWGADPNDHTRGFAYGNDWNTRRCTLEWLGEWDPWVRPNFQVDQTWEDVMYTYDFPVTEASVKMADRAQLDTDWSGEPFAPTAKAAGFGIKVQHDDVSDNWPRLRVNYLHDMRDAWQGVNAHGGPIVGPDGKIYYFEAENAQGAHPGSLFALRPACSGDVDGDGDTDLSDLAALLATYLVAPGNPGWNPNADFDCDGDVDLSDLAHLLADYQCGT